MTLAVTKGLGIACMVASTVRLMDWWHGTELGWPWQAYVTGFLLGLLMLFLGNIGTNVSYWGALPLGILASALLGGVTANRYDVAA